MRPQYLLEQCHLQIQNKGIATVNSQLISELEESLQERLTHMNSELWIESSDDKRQNYMKWGKKGVVFTYVGNENSFLKMRLTTKSEYQAKDVVIRRRHDRFSNQLEQNLANSLNFAKVKRKNTFDILSPRKLKQILQKLFWKNSSPALQGS